MTSHIALGYFNSTRGSGPNHLFVSLNQDTRKMEVNNRSVFLSPKEVIIARYIIEKHINRARESSPQLPPGWMNRFTTKCVIGYPAYQSTEDQNHRLDHQFGDRAFDLTKQLNKEVPSLRPLFVEPFKQREKPALHDRTDTVDEKPVQYKQVQEKCSVNRSSWKKGALLIAAFVGGGAVLTHWLGLVNLSPKPLYEALPETWKGSLDDLYNKIPEQPQWMRDSKAWFDKNMPQPFGK